MYHKSKKYFNCLPSIDIFEISSCLSIFLTITTKKICFCCQVKFSWLHAVALIFFPVAYFATRMQICSKSPKWNAISVATIKMYKLFICDNDKLELMSMWSFRKTKISHRSDIQDVTMSFFHAVVLKKLLRWKELSWSVMYVHDSTFL